MTQGFYLTASGTKSLQTELRTLRRRLVHIKDEIKGAAKDGIEENGSLDVAAVEFRFIDRRINEITYVLQNTVPIESISQNGHVQLGSRIYLECDDGVHEYWVVGSLEADPSANKISDQSPFGRALLNKRVGDYVEVTVPAGIKTCKVIKIS